MWPWRILFSPSLREDSGMPLGALWQGLKSDWSLVKQTELSQRGLYELWKIRMLFQISKPSAFIIYIYSLLSLDILKAVKYYIINLPDMSKILSYTDHNNWLATVAWLPWDWKATDILCGANNCIDVWVKQWGISNKTENRAMVRKWNAITQLEFG